MTDLRVPPPPKLPASYNCGPLAHALNTAVGIRPGVDAHYFRRDDWIYHALAHRRGHLFPVWAQLYRRQATVRWHKNYDYDVGVQISKSLDALPANFLEWTKDVHAFVTLENWHPLLRSAWEPVPGATPAAIASVLDRLDRTKWRRNPGFHYLWGFCLGIGHSMVGDLFGVTPEAARWGAVSAVQTLIDDPGFWIFHLNIDAELLFGGDVDVSLFHRASKLRSAGRNPLTVSKRVWKMVLLSTYNNTPAATKAFAGTRQTPYTFKKWPFMMSGALYAARRAKKLTEARQKKYRCSYTDLRLARMARDGTCRRSHKSR